MPSPIGHTLAGLTLSMAATPRTASTGTRVRLALACAACAALPDADLLLHGFGLTAHRTITHSVTSVALVTIIAAAVTGWVTRRPRSSGLGPIAIGLLCGAAWGSHLVLDWMGTDTNVPRGIQALWPWSDRWFVSGWDFFPSTERRHLLSMATFLINAKAAVFEMVVLGGVAAIVWWGRREESRRP